MLLSLDRIKTLQQVQHLVDCPHTNKDCTHKPNVLVCNPPYEPKFNQCYKLQTKTMTSEILVFRASSPKMYFMALFVVGSVLVCAKLGEEVSCCVVFIPSGLWMIVV